MLTFLLQPNNNTSTPQTIEKYNAQLPQLEERLKLINSTFLKEFPKDKRDKIRKTATQIVRSIKELKKLDGRIEAEKKRAENSAKKSLSRTSKSVSDTKKQQQQLDIGKSPELKGCCCAEKCKRTKTTKLWNILCENCKRYCCWGKWRHFIGCFLVS